MAESVENIARREEEERTREEVRRKRDVEAGYNLRADFMDAMAGNSLDFNFSDYLRAYPYNPSSRLRRLTRVVFPLE